MLTLKYGQWAALEAIRWKDREELDDEGRFWDQPGWELDTDPGEPSMLRLGDLALVRHRLPQRGAQLRP